MNTDQLETSLFPGLTEARKNELYHTLRQYILDGDAAGGDAWVKTLQGVERTYALALILVTHSLIENDPEPEPQGTPDRREPKRELTQGKCIKCGMVYEWKGGPGKRVRNAYCPDCGTKLEQTTRQMKRYGRKVANPTFRKDGKR